MTLNIDANNNVTGTDTISTSGRSTIDAGTINRRGNLNLTSTLNGTRVATIAATVLVVANQMTGTGTIAVNGTTTNFSLSLSTTNPQLAHR